MAPIKLNILSPDSINKAIKEMKARSLKAKNLNQQLSKITDDIESKFVKPMMKELEEYPHPRDTSRKVEWASNKQRLFFFWMVKNKKIKLPYQRQKMLQKLYKYTIKKSVRNLGFEINVENKAEYHDYVRGKLFVPDTRYEIRVVEKSIQPFHKRTWKPAHQIMKPYVKKAQKYFVDELTQYLLSDS